MKKHFTLIFTLFLLLLQIPASAQGEWKWANYWTGNDDPMNPSLAYNYVVRTAFDDDGNVYVFGSFGGNAFLYDQNQEIRFSDIPIIESNSSQGNVLVKFNAQGDLLWYKFIKSTQGRCLPYDMVVKDGVILIAGEYEWDYDIDKPLWFFDTLVTKQTSQSYPNGINQPPYTFGHYSYFVYFDSNGNRVESHFVKAISRELYNGQRYDSTLGRGLIGSYPLCVDSQGNTYFALATQYGGVESTPYTVVIDEDSSKIYDLFLPGNCGNYPMNNIMLYKFSPNWELVWMKLVVDHTEGLSPYLLTDSIIPYYNPFVGGMSIDNNGNLYLSGYMQDMFVVDEYNQYPMKFFWDSTHFATVSDHGLAFYLPFVIKYDADGNIQWSNQAFVRNPENANAILATQWTSNCVKDQSVYLFGCAAMHDGLSAEYYIGDESNLLPINQYSSYFVRLNKDNGAFESCGVVPGERTCLVLGKASVPAVINNHFMGICRSYINLNSYYLLNYFNVDGTFDHADTIKFLSSGHSAATDVTINDDGYILCNFLADQDLTFGNDITLNFNDDHRAHAVVALRNDPSILEPYPEDTTGIADRGSLSRAVVRAYPNPTTDKVTVEVMMPLEDDEIYLGDVTSNFTMERVTVTDLAGKVVLQRAVSGTRAELDFSALSAGTYIITASGEMGKWEGKVVKK